MLIHKTVEDEIVKNKIRELLKMKNPILEAEREEGREEGRIEGAIKKEKEFIKNMLAEGCSLEFISRISGRSVKESSLVFNNGINRLSTDVFRRYVFVLFKR